ncbi:MAG: ABC transporter permease [Proteobacteria bacterium]|nr:ABC transporter permease [Pseudomonadota bacterium]
MAWVAIARRELAGYYRTPLGWTLLTAFLLVQGYTFYLFVELMAQPFAPHGTPLRLFFGGTLLYWLFVILLVALTTMRLFAEERRIATLEGLLTAPVRPLAIVVGKYAAATIFYATLWLPTVLYVLIAAWLAERGAFDWGSVAAGYLGTLAIGATALAVGALCSALTAQPLLAALLCSALLVLWVLLGPLRGFVSDPALAALLERADVLAQLDDFARGLVDSRHLLLDASVITCCLSAATGYLGLRRRP